MPTFDMFISSIVYYNTIASASNFLCTKFVYSKQGENLITYNYMICVSSKLHVPDNKTKFIKQIYNHIHCNGNNKKQWSLMSGKKIKIKWQMHPWQDFFSGGI